MRVQRAPLAADQPQQPPARPATPFSTTADLDLTRLAARLDRARLVAEVAAVLAEACRAEGLIDDASPLYVVRPAGSRTADWATPSRRALTIVDAGAYRARPVGDWGLSGAVVATLGRVETAIVSRPQPDGSGLALAHRQLAPLTLVVPDARTQATAAMRAMETVARRAESIRL